MKKKIATVCGVFGALLLAAALFAWIAAFAGKADIRPPALAAAISLTVVGLGTEVCGFLMMYTPDKQTVHFRERVLDLPVQPDLGYRAELEAVRRNYAAAPMKKVPSVKALRNLWDRSFDLRVLREGEIYYACVVSTAVGLWEEERVDRSTQMVPAYLIYSTDEYYVDDPVALKEIAFALYEDRKNVWKEHEVFSNRPVKKELTGGREVYLSSCILRRAFLPLGYLSDRILPVIASPVCPSAFVVDKKYWTEPLLANCAHGLLGVEKKTISYRLAAIGLPVCDIPDFLKELKQVRENYAAAPTENIRKRVFRSFPNDERFFDTRVLKTGTIVYAYLVAAPAHLFDPTHADMGAPVLPAAVVYSLDEFYLMYPKRLAPIAKSLYENRANNPLKDPKALFPSEPVPDGLTGGRKVYLATVMVHRDHLPLGYLTDTLFPIIASPEETAAFVVDKKFWTDALTANFIHAKTVQDLRTE